MYGPSQGYEPHYYPRDEYNDYDDRYYGSNRNINDDYGYDNHNQYDDYEQDDVEPPHKTKKSDRRTRRKNHITMMISIIIIEITTLMTQHIVMMLSKI